MTMTSVFNKIKSLAISLFMSGLLMPQTVWAQFLQDPTIVNDPVENFNENAGFDTNTNLSSIVSTGIKAFLSILGIIFIILIIYAGYVYMMAGGNESEVDKAKTTIRRAIIGLIITVSAYAITYFVFSNLDSMTTGGGSYAP